MDHLFLKNPPRKLGSKNYIFSYSKSFEILEDAKKEYV